MIILYTMGDNNDQGRFNFGIKDAYNRNFGENMEMTDDEKKKYDNIKNAGVSDEKAREIIREDRRKNARDGRKNWREEQYGKASEFVKTDVGISKGRIIGVVAIIFILLGTLIGLYAGGVSKNDITLGVIIGFSCTLVILGAIFLIPKKGQTGGGKYKRALRQSVGNSLETSMFLPGFN